MFARYSCLYSTGRLLLSLCPLYSLLTLILSLKTDFVYSNHRTVPQKPFWTWCHWWNTVENSPHCSSKTAARLRQTLPAPSHRVRSPDLLLQTSSLDSKKKMLLGRVVRRKAMLTITSILVMQLVFGPRVTADDLPPVAFHFVSLGAVFVKVVNNGCVTCEDSNAGKQRPQAAMWVLVVLTDKRVPFWMKFASEYPKASCQAG